MFRKFIDKWKGRKRRKFSEMSDVLLALFLASGSVVASLYGYVLLQITPSYFEVANKTPLSDWGVQGWFLTVILVALATQVWFSKSLALRCGAILRERWFR